ncbi:MAG: CCA tRNA nucleotidyltransferase [Thermodesulfobacteriota bacterium]
MLDKARKIIEILDKRGHRSYFVGGCVRDMLMKKPIIDIDITTSARPEEVMLIFPEEDIFAVPTGMEHGTVTIVYNGLNIEITTFRRDVSTDGRRSTVEFGTSLEEDLLRRDFTINAIAYCPKLDRYIDPYGGMEDIQGRVIRAVGLPLERFREDYLRMIRAHRFEATLEFVIAEATRAALALAARDDWRTIISVERIRDEIKKCLEQAERPSVMFEGMRKSGLLKMILPELDSCFGFEQNKYHEFDLYHHTLLTIDEAPKELYLVRWSALLHDLGKPSSCENYGPDATFYKHEMASVEISGKLMKRLKFSKKETASALNLVRHHMFQYSDDMKDSTVRRFVASVGVENLKDLCALWFADKSAMGRNIDPKRLAGATAILSRLEKMSEAEKIFKLKDLAIDGKEVMDIRKIPPSHEVGSILKKLYENVIEDTTLNTNEQLKRMVESM